MALCQVAGPAKCALAVQGQLEISDDAIPLGIRIVAPVIDPGLASAECIAHGRRTVIDERKLGRLQARIESLERFARLLNLLPLMVVLAMVAWQWVYIAGQFDKMDDRMDLLEAALARIEQNLEQVLSD